MTNRDGYPRETARNTATIDEFKRVVRALASQGIHMSVNNWEGDVEFWKRNSIHPGRSHGISKPFKTRAFK